MSLGLVSARELERVLRGTGVGTGIVVAETVMGGRGMETDGEMRVGREETWIDSREMGTVTDGCESETI